MVAHGCASRPAAPCSPVRAARRTRERGLPCAHGWELLTVAHPCPYKGVGDPSPLSVALLSVPITTRHHFANMPGLIAAPAALVSTCADGSPIANAAGHTVQVALTPAAAAALLRMLEGQPLPDQLSGLVVGLRGAAVDALERA